MTTFLFSTLSTLALVTHAQKSFLGNDGGAPHHKGGKQDATEGSWAFVSSHPDSNT